jgi:DNA-directed RNA polymerase specialized sigma24 family protein
MFQNHINLVRKIAWSFHKSTGIEWKELFSEATVAYFEGMRFHNPEKGAMTTWIYQWITGELINFCKREQRFKSPTGIDDWYSSSSDSFKELFSPDSKLSPDTQEITKMVLNDPLRYALPPRKAIGQIRKDLREVKKWSWPRIEQGMKNLRTEFTANENIRKTNGQRVEATC